MELYKCNRCGCDTPNSDDIRASDGRLILTYHKCDACKNDSSLSMNFSVREKRLEKMNLFALGAAMSMSHTMPMDLMKAIRKRLNAAIAEITLIWKSKPEGYSAQDAAYAICRMITQGRLTSEISLYSL